MSTPRRLATYLIYIVIILLIVGLTKDIWQLSHADDRVKEAEQKLAKIKLEQQKLNSQLNYYQSPEFLETQIRDKLQMIKPGETMVVLPEGLLSEATEDAQQPISNEEPANWQKWWQLFW